MKKSILALSITLLSVVVCYSQTAATRTTNESTTHASSTLTHQDKSVTLQSGTRLAAELQNSIDVRNAKVGDQVVLKTTQAIKSGGRTIVGKGARLLGRVTDVAQKTKSSSESHIGILFDRLEHGSLAMPITASISSITSGRASARANNEDVFASDVNTSSSSRASTSANSGGLLGGVGGVVNNTTATAGNIVGNTTSAVGTTVNSTTNAVGSTAAGATRSLGRIQISESSSTSVEGGSMLTLQGGNLRLDKGTNFNLVVTQSASAEAGPKQ